jgi:hypothetical protein
MKKKGHSFQSARVFDVGQGCLITGSLTRFRVYVKGGKYAARYGFWGMDTKPGGEKPHTEAV